MHKGQNEDGAGYVKYRHVDDYWHRVLQLTDGRGEPKYPDLAVVIKMALSLSHGQADIERGFSINKKILDDHTSLGEKTLSATRTVKEVIQQYGSIRNIPMTTSLFAAYRGAHKVYKEDLDREKAA